MTATKLPLSTRQNVRDEFENKREDQEKKIKDLLGEEYKIEVNFLDLYAKATTEYAKTRPGNIAYDSVRSFIEEVERTSKKGDKVAVDHINSVLTARKLVILVEDEIPGSYSGCRVTDGVFEMLYKPDTFGSNVSSVCEYFEKALDKGLNQTSPKALPLIAKLGLKKEWEAKQADIEKSIKEELNGTGLTCHVNPEEIWGEVYEAYEAHGKKRDNPIDIETVSRNLGLCIREYFADLPYMMRSKFKQDDMLVEGLLDEVTTKEVWLQLVPKDKLTKSYNDCVIEDGKLIGRMSPQTWGTNTSGIWEKLKDIL